MSFELVSQQKDDMCGQKEVPLSRVRAPPPRGGRGAHIQRELLPLVESVQLRLFDQDPPGRLPLEARPTSKL